MSVEKATQVVTKVEAEALYDRFMAAALQSGRKSGIMAAPGRVIVEPSGDTHVVQYQGCVEDALRFFAAAEKAGKIGGDLAANTRYYLTSELKGAGGDPNLWPKANGRKGSGGKPAFVPKSAVAIHAEAVERIATLNKELTDLKAAIPGLKAAADAELKAQAEADKLAYEALKAQMAELEKRLGIGVKPAAAPAAK